MSSSSKPAQVIVPARKPASSNGESQSELPQGQHRLAPVRKSTARTPTTVGSDKSQQPAPVKKPTTPSAHPLESDKSRAASQDAGQTIKKTSGPAGPVVYTPSTYKPPSGSKPSMSLFICFDGTGNNKNSGTNIYRLFHHAKELPGKQAKCYITGVGADWNIDMIQGNYSGKGIERKLWEGYNFLMRNVSQGAAASTDRLSVIGFSRGAFTASCFVTFLNDVGLYTAARRPNKLINQSEPLRAKPMEEQFYLLFTSWRKAREGSPRSFDKEQFLTALGYNPDKFQRIEGIVLGLFDTVSALEGGVPASKPKPTRQKLAFIDGVVPPNVKTAFHALALFEHRRSFTPSIWTRWEKTTDVQQCWFAGCHSDVGGFSTNKHPIHHFALLWVMSMLTDVEFWTYNLMDEIEKPVKNISEKMFNDSYDATVLIFPKFWHAAGSEERRIPTLLAPTEEQIRKSQESIKRPDKSSFSSTGQSIHWTTASFVAFMDAKGMPCHPLQGFQRLPLSTTDDGGRLPCWINKSANLKLPEEMPNLYEIDFVHSWAGTDRVRQEEVASFIQGAGKAKLTRTGRGPQTSAGEFPDTTAQRKASLGPVPPNAQVHESRLPRPAPWKKWPGAYWYLEKTLVQTWKVDPNTKCYFGTDANGGRIDINMNTSILDTKKNEWGYFQGSKWWLSTDTTGPRK
ncbi:hypothetical protein B0T21DRAFT_183726 [Apiosordaria backusii]|uniref:T6SS Phospholipase effector Tle1-like catalytic domain-containing protein n=1 Tax=Apiosordaria backusii TaxID=314023 RepID=A0AA40ECW0_9PEZI|nr:hypothetical protein B0T21DRAFT_183726 [Apiosordaria backusii]